MRKFNDGDKVRWEGDVDKVYSKDTKTLVGKVGTILPPQEYYAAPFGGNKYLTPEGYFDVEFSYEGRPFIVGNILESELIKVEMS